MATYKEEHCTVCLKHLPKSSTRRKLNSESTKHVVPVLREVAGRNFRAELVSVLLPDSDDTFLCRQCFRNAEKLQQLRRELLGLECKLVDLLKQSKLQRGLGPDVDVELETAPSAAPHTPTASEGSPKPGLQHPSTPLRVSARKRRTLDSGHVAQLPACSATGSPGQPPPTKRRALDTPSREFMQQAHVASSPSVAVLVKMRQSHRVYHLTSSLKRIGRSVGRRSHKSIALQSIKSKRIKMFVLKILAKDIRKELVALCSVKNNSILRSTEPRSLQTFSWDSLLAEVKETAPTLLTILDGLLEVHIPPSKEKRKKTAKTQRVNKAAIIGLCTAILCRYRNQSMNLVQRLLSILMYKGGANKQMFRRLQRLLICLSHKRTVAYLDKLGENHDALVHGWKQSILEAKTVEPQEGVLTELQSTVETTTHQHECANHDELTEESSAVSSVPESSVSSPVAPTYSPILSMSSLTSTNSSSQDSGNRLQMSKAMGNQHTYKLVGDNIDKTVKPRDMRIGSQTQSLHYFHAYAVKDRVDVSHMEDQPSLPSLESMDLATILPNEQDHKALKGLFSIHVARVLIKFMPFFAKFGSGLERHIKHDFFKEMSQKSEVVPLGVTLKSETKTEDMVAILEDLHSYVPTTSRDLQISVEIPGQDEHLTVTEDDFHYTLLGGDQLTAARVRGSQRVRNNGQRGLDRLEGVAPVVEDWHAKGCLLAAIWKRLYKCSSGRDHGTLYHLRNVINRRNVVKKPKKAVNACEEFFLLVVEAHILSSAMMMFGVAGIDCEPTSRQYFPVDSQKLAAPERKQVLLMASGALVDKYVDLSMEKAKNTSDSSAREVSGHDGVVEYASEVLTLGLLLMEFNDAIREGDGNRICRCWQYFLLIFKATGRKNYSIEALTLLAQLNFFFSPRMAAQLKWGRTVNTHGRPGKNVPCDLHMEHLNRVLKGAISGLGSNISDKAVLRMGKCLGQMDRITNHFDDVNCLPSESGKHARKSEKEDCNKILQVLNEMRVFHLTPGRKHANFPRFEANAAKKLSCEDLKKWMKEQVQKLILQ